MLERHWAVNDCKWRYTKLSQQIWRWWTVSMHEKAFTIQVYHYTYQCRDYILHVSSQCYSIFSYRKTVELIKVSLMYRQRTATTETKLKLL